MAQSRFLLRAVHSRMRPAKNSYVLEGKNASSPVVYIVFDIMFLQTMLALAVFCAICQSIGNLIVDFLFDEVLAASVSHEVSMGKSVAVTARRLSTAIRRSSTVAVAPSPTAQASGEKDVLFDRAEFGCFLRSTTTRIVPDHIAGLHEAVSNSLTSLRHGFLEPQSRYDSSSTNMQYSTVFGVTVQNADVARNYEMLMEKIAIQRSGMNAMERRQFDTEWR